jgi:uncharacterized circularly permuted ATP-grasp superfamily protein/uncharacterized alpha-E superfamily protein
MTTTAPTPSGPRYEPRSGAYDEMLQPSGEPRAHWTHVAGVFDELGVEELLRRRGLADQLLDQDGVVYNAYGDGRPQAAQAARRWLLDPMPTVVSSAEWRDIEGGVIERAELLNLVLEDLYGERRLLRRRLLPPEAVFSHGGFLRECDGVRLPTAQQLFAYAADLGRDPEGRWAVLSDRAQAPSGFGYAFENRLVISRVFPSLYRDSHVHRLAPFLRALRVALQDAAPPGVDDPRIVVLTPGPWNETAFEHAFLASRLGYPLVEGSDLIVRGGQVRMRSVGALEPVHVILRRVDAGYCDPLELKGDSRLGTPGLVEATRTGAVSVVNTLGSAVLENPALPAFLPALSEHLLGRPLRLPSVATWWCGDEEGRRHVLAHLADLVLRPLRSEVTVLGRECSSAQLDDLRRRIEAEPLAWVGQESLELGRAPLFTPGGLQPRRSVLRAFAVARGDSYMVMPGGLTRVAPGDGDGRISNQHGAISKDTWVLASEPERLTGFWLQTGAPVESVDPMASIPARAAENLWWLGRYAERAEAVARLLRAVNDRRNEFQGSDNPAGVAALRALLVALSRITATDGFLGGDEAAQERLRSPGDELRRLVVDEQLPGTVAHAVRGLLDAAQSVRDQLSGDTWLVVGALDSEIRELRGPAGDSQAALQSALQRAMQGLLALHGLTGESLVRDVGWRFLDGGRRLERAVQLLSLLRATVTEAYDTATDSLVLESVLVSAESIITYRRRYRSHAQLPTLLDLLLLDAHNPRSLAWQLERLGEDFDALPASGERRLREEQRLLLEASTTMRLADTEALAGPEEAPGGRPELQAFLAELLDRLLRTGGAVEAEHFVHVPPQRALVGPADAGMPAADAQTPET